MRKKLQALVMVMCLALPAVAVAQPGAMSAPTAMAPAPMTTEMPAATTMEASPPKKSADDIATTVLKWVALVGGALAGIFISIFGVKKLLRHMSIIESIRNGVASWNEHAKGTDYKWDDAASQLLLDISNKLLAEGRKELSEQEKEKVLALATAEKKIVGPDPNIEIHKR